MLEQIERHSKLRKADYKARLPVLQRRLHQLQQACWEAGLASVLVIESFDAAGKGRIIRKLTERLEPRGFDLHAIAAARTVELQLPWLWRFWARVPSYGHMAIFDGSWYRRVLVERVEGQATTEEWQRAFEDIAAFERALNDDHCEIIKLFLYIDKSEQGRRLTLRQQDARHAWRLSAGDWERHERYEAYLAAAEEMLQRTATEWAAWTIVDSTNKRWARIRVFEAVIGSLEDGLRRHGHAVPAEPADQRPDGAQQDRSEA